MGALEEVGQWETQVSSTLGQAAHARPLKDPTLPAIFSPVGRTYRSYIQGKNSRTLDRARRRMRRRQKLGQPQLMGDLKRLQER
ncbi:MAG: hypothetical protein SOR40_06255 [Rothia sp. (in: high G+C Gram-positive bacteria)]|nr:hypothetical protein [Rothia sp. (in: high G+C Gram-positive bacteria)]